MFTFSSSAFTFLIEMIFSFNSLFAIWSLSPQRFHYYFNLSTVSWQYQKYANILILVLCLLCVTHLTQALPRLHLSSAADDRRIVSDLHIHLFSNVFHRRRRISPRRPGVLADSRIALLCHALRICVAHAPPKSCPFSLLVH